MTAIEFEEYLIAHGMPDKTARATAMGVEKLIAKSAPVTADKLTSELRGMKIELMTAGALGLAPLYAKLFGFI